MLFEVIARGFINANIKTSNFGQKEVRALKDGAATGLRGDAAIARRREKRKSAGVDTRWTFSEHCRVCEGMTNVGLFSAIAVDSKTVVVPEQDSLQHFTVFGVWKRRCAVLRK